MAATIPYSDSLSAKLFKNPIKHAFLSWRCFPAHNLTHTFMGTGKGQLNGWGLM